MHTSDMVLHPMGDESRSSVSFGSSGDTYRSSRDLRFVNVYLMVEGKS